METDSGKSNYKDQNKDAEIIIQFPTELVPDEYKHENGSDGQVYIFHDEKGKPLAEKLKQSLNVHKFDISPQNSFAINHANEVLTVLDKVAVSDFTEKSCLLLIIIGAKYSLTTLLDKNQTLKIWSPFINNSSLKYKPKIFMFFEYEEIGDKRIKTDSDNLRFYDVPAEADVVIVHQKSAGIDLDGQQYGFLDKFSKNVEKYGTRDDIVGLLTRTKHTFRPVIISTLRKKFYLSSSRYREHYFDILNNGENVLKELETLISNFNQQIGDTERENGRISSNGTAKNSSEKTINFNEK